MSEVRVATPVDADAVAWALADAFAEDPLLVWLSPARGYPERSRHLYRFMVDHTQAVGSVDVLVEEGRTVGAALWLPPGHWRVPPLAILRGVGKVMRAGGHRVPRMLSRLSAVEMEHPASPDHWYLAAIGVVRSRQGQGVGSALLSRRTAQFDADRTPAYLECSNERNIPLYERHGFAVTKTLTFRQGPPQWLMWRDPRP